MKEKISVIGNGFVGSAVSHGLSSHYDVAVYDKDPRKSFNTLKEINQADIIFICVPTPTDESRKIDTSIIENSISNLSDNKVLVIKSTITPEAASRVISKFPNQQIVINPEFLSERTALEDFMNPSRIVIGGSSSSVAKVKAIYEKVFPDANYICTDAKTASFIKYFSNCFYASKVSLMNEFRQVCDKEGMNWDTALEGLLSSGWVNPMHTMVPGPDGRFGFGGKCFPKDINAFITYTEDLGVEASMLKAAWEKNLKVREAKDWLKIKGAFSKKEKISK